MSLTARFSSLVVLFLASLTVGCHGTYFLTISPLTPYPEWKYDGNLGYAFLESDAVPGLVPFTLLRDKSVESPNTYDLRYLYTASLEIKQRLTNGGPWVEEEIAFYVYPTETKNSQPLHQLSSHATGDILWSTDPVELQTLKAQGYWTYEGVACWLPVKPSPARLVRRIGHIVNLGDQLPGKRKPLPPTPPKFINPAVWDELDGSEPKHSPPKPKASDPPLHPIRRFRYNPPPVPT